MSAMQRLVLAGTSAGGFPTRRMRSLTRRRPEEQSASCPLVASAQALRARSAACGCGRRQSRGRCASTWRSQTCRRGSTGWGSQRHQACVGMEVISYGSGQRSLLARRRVSVRYRSNGWDAGRTAEIFDVASDTWTVAADVPRKAGSGGFAAVLDNGLVLYGGGGPLRGRLRSRELVPRSAFFVSLRSKGHNPPWRAAEPPSAPVTGRVSCRVVDRRVSVRAPSR